MLRLHSQTFAEPEQGAASSDRRSRDFAPGGASERNRNSVADANGNPRRIWFGRIRGAWRNLPLARKSTLAVLLPIEALLLGFVLLYFLSASERAAQRTVERHREVRYVLRAVVAETLTAETNLRGFAITRDEAFVRQSDEAARSLRESLRKLSALAAGDSVLMPEVRDLERLATNATDMMAATREALASSAPASGSGPSEQLRHADGAVRQLQSEIAQIDAREAQEAALGDARVERVRELTIAASAGTVALGLLGGLLGVSLVSRYVVRRVEMIGANADRLAREVPLLPAKLGGDEISRLGQRISLASELLAQRTAALRAEKEQLQRNIAEREKAEAALRESEARLQAILDQTNAVVYVKDLESRYQLVNRQFETVAGVDRNNARGRTSADLFGAEIGKKLLEHDQQVLRSGVPREFEEVVQLQDEERVYLSLKFPLLDRKGVPYAICGMSSDITERKASERALRTTNEELEARVRTRTAELEETNATLRREAAEHRETAERLKQTQEQYLHAQKLEALGLLAGGVAHDFNNVLTAIMGYGTVLLEQLPPSERDGSHVAEILRAAERAAGLSKQLLAFSRRQAYQPTLLDLSGLVREIEKMLRQVLGERVILETELAQDIGSVHADPGQIEQMLLNLVVNARDAMPGDGTIVISTCAVSLPLERIKVTTDEREFLALSVRDNGTGIPPEIMERMFDPFFTTKHPGQGTGLGLATCRAIAEQSGGWLDCESTVGVWTEFTLYLPRVNRVAERVQPEKREHLRSGTETILVVEDEPVVGDIVSLLLRNLGYDVIRAENGVEAETAIAERGAAGIDLVLTDLNMPRMNGRELVERLTADNPHLKVLLTSGNDDLIDEERAAELRVDFLPKPFTMQTLAAKVRAVLDA